MAQDEADWLAPNTRAEELAGALLYGVTSGIARLAFRLRVEGLEHLPDSRQI